MAYVMSRFPKLSETFILREMLELERLGQPVIICPLFPLEETVRHPEVEQLMDRVHRLPMMSGSILAANLRCLVTRPLAYLGALFTSLKETFGSRNLFLGVLAVFPKAVALAARMQRLGVAHVHAHFATHPAFAAFVISRVSGLSYSVTVHAHDIFVHHKMLCRKLREARFVAAISEFNIRYLRDLCGDEARFEVIRCGIELERYEIVAPRERPMTMERRPTKDRRTTILCVASLQEYKGVRHLVGACARLEDSVGDYRCLIVGDGPEREDLERRIREAGLGDRVVLLGAQPQGEVARLLREVDLFAHPSVVAADGQMDGIPVALIEAMASRLPVVASRLSGIPELVIDRQNGLLTEPGDEEALAEALAELCRRPDWRRELGASGREKVVAEYQLRPHVARLHELFAEAAAAR